MLNGRGKGLILGILFLLTVGTLLNIAELFAMAGGLGSLAVYSYFVARNCAGKLKLSHHGPGLVQVGQPFELFVSLQGSETTEQIRLDVSLNLPDSLELVDVQKHDHIPGALATWKCRMIAVTRGEHTVGHITINVQDPVGLICLRKGITEPTAITAWPQPMDPGIRLTAIEQPSVTGHIETSVRAMDGASTYGVRQWAPGDTLRRVHWPSTARLGKLAVMEFESEISCDVTICLDTRHSNEEEAFETACRVVSYFLHQAWGKRHRVTLMIDGKCAADSSLDRASSHREILNTLARVKADSKRSLEESILTALRQLPSHGSLILVTSHWDVDAGRTFGAIQASNSGAMAIVVPGDCPGDFAIAETISGMPGVYILRIDDTTVQ